MESQFTLFAWLFALAIIISSFWVMILGFNNQLVIYQDKKDFFRVILTINSFTITGVLIEKAQQGSLPSDVLVTWFVIPILCLTTLVLVIDNFILCFRHNNHRVLIGSLIAIYRYFYLLLALLLIIRIMGGGDGKRKSYGEMMLEITGVAAVGYGIYRLINGEKVKALRNSQITDSYTE